MRFKAFRKRALSHRRSRSSTSPSCCWFGCS